MIERTRLRLPGSGIEIALHDWGGDGPLALLHHANGFCAAVWEPVAEGLAQRFHVIAMDARGHGDSSKPTGREPYAWENFTRDAEAVAEALAVRHGPIRLGLGHSFGGTALTLAAIARPQLFDRLMLLDPIVMPRDPARVGWRRIDQTNPLADGARRRREVWDDRRQARASWAKKPAFAEWTERCLDLYVAEGLADRPDGRVELKCPGEVEAVIFESGMHIDVMGRVARLEAPTLVVWASRGNFSRSHFEELAATMPRGEVVDAATGHFVPMEDPAWVVEQALAFTARPEDRDGSTPSSPPAASGRT